MTFRTFFLNLGAALDQCVEAKFDGTIWKILNLVQDFVPLDCQIIICWKRSPHLDMSCLFIVLQRPFRGVLEEMNFIIIVLQHHYHQYQLKSQNIIINIFVIYHHRHYNRHHHCQCKSSAIQRKPICWTNHSKNLFPSYNFPHFHIFCQKMFHLGECRGPFRPS